MLIRGYDIEEGTRERMLLKAEELFEISELPMVEGGSGYRRFRLTQKGTNCGEIYEDALDPDVLVKLS